MESAQIGRTPSSGLKPVLEDLVKVTRRLVQPAEPIHATLKAQRRRSAGEQNSLTMGNSMRRGYAPVDCSSAAINLAFGMVYAATSGCEPDEAESSQSLLQRRTWHLSSPLSPGKRNLFFNLRARHAGTWKHVPLLAEIDLRAFAIATTIAAVIAGLQSRVIYDRPLSVSHGCRTISQNYRDVLRFVGCSAARSMNHKADRRAGPPQSSILGRYLPPDQEKTEGHDVSRPHPARLPWPKRFDEDAHAGSPVRASSFVIDEPIVAHGGALITPTWATKVIMSCSRLRRKFPRDGVLTAFLPSRIPLREAVTLLDAKSTSLDFGSALERRLVVTLGHDAAIHGSDSLPAFPMKTSTARLPEHYEGSQRDVFRSHAMFYLLRRVRPSPVARVVALDAGWRYADARRQWRSSPSIERMASCPRARRPSLAPEEARLRRPSSLMTPARVDATHHRGPGFSSGGSVPTQALLLADFLHD